MNEYKINYDKESENTKQKELQLQCTYTTNQH